MWQFQIALKQFVVFKWHSEVCIFPVSKVGIEALLCSDSISVQRNLHLSSLIHLLSASPS